MRKVRLISLLLAFLLAISSLYAQIRTISGIVSDQKGEPIIGAAVVIKGSMTGTVTDMEGKYAIQAEKGATLQFSFIGYESKTVVVGNSNLIQVTLKDTTVGLDEVLVVGYGTQTKRTVTSSISKVDGDVLLNKPINSVGDGLKGKIAGAQVYSTNNTPGAEPTIRIRGGSSIDRSNDPLILVDGIERDLSGINPNDIESIEILKDAASAAIYGSRASNGVVLVTTRRGSESTAPTITFEASWAMENTERMIDYLNSEEALTLMRPRLLQGPHPNYVTANNYAYSSGNTSTSIYSTRYLQEGESVPAGYRSMADPIDPDKTLIFMDNDWVKESFKTALWQNYYLGVNGGSEKIRYTGSLGYMKDDGVAVGTNFSRFSARTNADVQLTKRLKFSGGFDFNQTLTNAYASQYQVLTRGMMTPTTQRVLYEDGEWAGTPTPGYNSSSPTPVFYSYYNDNEQKVNKLGIIGGLDWDILDGLKANLQTSLFTSTETGDSFQRANIRNGSRPSSSVMTDIQRQKLEAYFSYNKTFKETHSLSAMAGYSYQRYKYKYLKAAAQDASSDKIPTLNAGPTKTEATTTMNEEVLIGYFGRFMYDYKKKYMLMFTFREDASSRFAKGNQWGFFPGVSAGWVMSDESFMERIKGINSLKWRISYGQTGNNSIGYYDALGLYAISTKYDGEATIVPSAMPNQGLTWESSTQLDVGIDMGFLNNRIQVSADYFNKLTSNLITTKKLPNTSGFDNILTNIGQVRFYGFDIELTTKNIQTQDFTWESKFTWSYVKNKVEKLPDNGRGKHRIGGYTVKMSDGSTYEFGGTAEGEPLGRFYGYRTDFIITTQEQADQALYDESSRGWDWQSKSSKGVGKKAVGDYEWKDLNGDGRINGNDMFYLGTILPHSTGGFNNTFSYKNFSLSIYFDWALGHSISNNVLQRQMCNFFGNNTSLPREVLNCWDPEAGQDVKDAVYARFGGNDSDDLNKNFRPNSNVFTTKGDYLCLRDITLQYVLPSAWTNKMGIQGLAFTVSGNNLHYFTAVKGISPETGTSNAYSSGYYSYPPIRKISFGLKLTL